MWAFGAANKEVLQRADWLVCWAIRHGLFSHSLIQQMPVEATKVFLLLYIQSSYKKHPKGNMDDSVNKLFEQNHILQP